MLVPSFQYNLIFIFQLLTQLNCHALLTTVSLFLKGPSLKRPLEIGKVEHGLYILHMPSTATTVPVMSLTDVSTFDCNSHYVHSNNSTSNVANSYVVFPSCVSNSVLNTHCISPVIPNKCISNSINENDVLWYQRMGHLPFAKMLISEKISSK